MAKCSCPAPVDTHEDGSVCPASGTVGAPVDLITIKASVLALLAPAPSDAADQQQPTKSADQAATESCTLKVSGMTCASCDVAVRLAAKSVSGVKSVKVDYPKARADVTYDPSKTNPQAIADAITKVSGLKTEPVKPAHK